MSHTHIGNSINDGSLKQFRRVARVPFTVSVGEIRALDMTRDAGEHYSALPPALKVVVKAVVFDPINAAHISLF